VGQSRVVNTSDLTYRPDIDGLRAVAVSAIVLFHLQSKMLPGGYLGVDIFFVISGYLITSIIIKRSDLNLFSLLEFYRRRVLRIVPAFIVMIVVTCGVSIFILLPLEMRALTASAAAAAGFTSNIYFWREASYFGGVADGRPLLHTWSLSVEEQFYIFYPILLLFLVKHANKSRALLFIACVSTISFVLNVIFAESNPVPVFYLLPARAWELGIGGGVALIDLKQRAKALYGRELAFTGLIAILAAVALAQPDTPTQQVWALVACAGAACLLLASDNPLSNGLLSVRPLRLIGRWSYSLYLWHWPIISLYRINYSNELVAGEIAALFAFSMLAAVISFHVIELPMQRRFRNGPALPIVITGVLSSALVVAAALLLGSRADRLRAWPPEIARIAAYADYHKRPKRLTLTEQRCAVVRPDRASPPACPARDGPSAVLLLGDSHAQHIRRALALRFPAQHVIFTLGHGCRPILGSRGPRECTQVLEQALRQFIEKRQVQAVVLAAQWTDEDMERITKTINVIRRYGVRVIVIGPVVEYNGSFPSLLARAIWSRNLRWLDHSRRRKRALLDRRMEQVVRATGAHYFSPYQRECPRGRCYLFSRAGEPLHFDYGHFTFSGSTDIIAGLDPAELSQ
jgi:peptidoglycan/LPS O-acetylase OafA/YrhL